MNLSELNNYLNKILIFYFPGKAGYWNSLTKCNIVEKPKKLSRYYLDFLSKADYPGDFSEQGIPLYSYRGNNLIEHPTVISQYAFAVYELLYRKNFKNEKLKEKFLNLAYWFENNKVNVVNGYGWCIDVKLPEYGLIDPWISSMAQGQSISVLTRAAQLTKDLKFEELAKSALSPFEFEVQNGGLINYFNSNIVYEEFPSRKQTMAVLNGFIFSLFGLYDLILLNNNERAVKLFNDGILSLKKLLTFFDLGYWTRYYLFDFPQKYFSSYTYHILVTEQLKALFIITGDEVFKEYYLRWDSYSKSFINKSRVIFQKLIYANKVIS